MLKENHLTEYLCGEQEFSVAAEVLPELQELEPECVEVELECERERERDRERLEPETEADSLPDRLENVQIDYNQFAK